MLPAADDFLDATRPSGWLHDQPAKGAAEQRKHPIQDKQKPTPPVAEDSMGTCG
ncbi:MAG TPA: hypothetical protein VHT74_29875 [Acetobacteraceae bacterium]|nr:hypothetical protein [Acetobacteraceae bacterium]